MAVSELAPLPVAFYAAAFFLVNTTYIALIWELIQPIPGAKAHRVMRIRSLITLILFAAASVTALKHPVIGLAICIACLVVYLRPEPPWAEPGGKPTETT